MYVCVFKYFAEIGFKYHYLFPGDMLLWFLPALFVIYTAPSACNSQQTNVSVLFEHLLNLFHYSKLDCYNETKENKKWELDDNLGLTILQYWI